jgi:hypothetical protein
VASQFQCKPSSGELSEQRRRTTYVKHQGLNLQVLCLRNVSGSRSSASQVVWRLLCVALRAGCWFNAMGACPAGQLCQVFGRKRQGGRRFEEGRQDLGMLRPSPWEFVIADSRWSILGSAGTWGRMYFGHVPRTSPQAQAWAS